MIKDYKTIKYLHCKMINKSCWKAIKIFNNQVVNFKILNKNNKTSQEK